MVLTPNPLGLERPASGSAHRGLRGDLPRPRAGGGRRGPVAPPPLAAGPPGTRPAWSAESRRRS